MYGKIYIIRCFLNDVSYIGSTIHAMESRMKQHLYFQKIFINFKLYKAMLEYGPENFYINLLENYNYNEVKELRSREGEYIKFMKPCLNSNIAGRGIKQYQEDNKIKLNEYRKLYYRKYRCDNKERIDKYNKEYKMRKL